MYSIPVPDIVKAKQEFGKKVTVSELVLKPRDQ